MLNLSAELKEIRAKLGKSQKKIADDCDIPQTTWSNYETGKAAPPIAILKKLAEWGYPIQGIELENLEEKNSPKKTEIQRQLEVARAVNENLPAEILSKITSLEFRLTSVENLIVKNLKPFIERLASLEAIIKNSNHYFPENEDTDTVKVLFVHDIAAGVFIPSDEDNTDYIDVPRKYIKTFPADYYAAHIKGQSMTAADIPDDSIVLIRQSNIPKDSTIQVVSHDGKTTLKRMKRDENNNWQLCYDDNTSRCIEIKPNETYHIFGDFVAVLPAKGGL